MPSSVTTRGLRGARDHVSPLLGDRCVGAWRIVRHLATGGFGTVYEVAHTQSGRRGALKVLHAHLVTSPEMVARLVREAHVIARLDHPNVVELLDAAVDIDGQPFLVMEYLDGVDLDRHVEEHGRLAPHDALVVLAPLCGAIAAAHALGVVHRDIKASNVFLVGDGAARRIVLLDFGIAKVLDAGTAELTSSRQALGTPASMAPEQIRGGHIDGRADVYALGALTYFLLTGRTPFDEASVTISQYLHLHAARPRPSTLAPVAPAIDEVVVHAMAIDPAHRHPDAPSFLAALRRAIDGDRATSAAPAEIVEAVAIRVGFVAATDADRDEATVDDIAAILSIADAELFARGFAFGRDLGEASLYVHAGLDDTQAVAAARALATALASRPGAGQGITPAVWLHRAPGTVVDGEIIDGALHDPSSWGLPTDQGGLWLTGAISGGDGARRKLA